MKRHDEPWIIRVEPRLREPMYDLSNRSALVTGGTKGIGRGIAKMLALAGASVWIGGRDRDAAQYVATEIHSSGGVADVVALDVTDSASVSACLKAITKSGAGIDILVNNAGIHCERIGEVSSIEDFEKCMNVNLFGVWRVSQAVVPYMKARPTRRIVNIGSIDGRKAWVDTPAYSASKAAVISLTQSLAVSFKPVGINVNAVCPGGVMTAMADRFKEAVPTLEAEILASRALNRALEPEDIGRAVVFFASDSSRNLTGHCLNVCGGTVFN